MNANNSNLNRRPSRLTIKSIPDSSTTDCKTNADDDAPWCECPEETMYKIQIYYEGIGVQGWTSCYLDVDITDEDACFDTRDEAIRVTDQLAAAWPVVDIRVIEVDTADQNWGAVTYWPREQLSTPGARYRHAVTPIGKK
jgi:hypothetical protein